MISSVNAHLSSSRHVSIVQVARAAGVSYQTVSRVINHSPNVSASTRAAVQKVIDEMGYRPSNSARTLASRHSRTIGFIAGGTHYYGPISTMEAIESVARSHGLFLSVSILKESEYERGAMKSVCESMLVQGVDAIILLTPTKDMFEAALSIDLPVPSVILTSTFFGLSSEQVASPGRHFLGIDQAIGCEALCNHLLKLGHRRFLVLNGPQEWGDAVVRLSAWKRLCGPAAVEAGIDVEAHFADTQSWDAQDAYRVCKQMLLTTPTTQLPTAIVASNDLQALAVLKALHDLGIGVPQQISVAGFDDMTGSDVSIPALTTVRQDFSELGAQAMKTVLAALQEENADHDDHTDHGDHMDRSGNAPQSNQIALRASQTSIQLFPPQLILRQSVGPVMKKRHAKK